MEYLTPQSSVTCDRPLVICIMGPTASGKTDLAIALTEYLPVDIISVDSALVYRGMDIGTAKPTAEELARAPHQLIDLCEPEEAYSAADFCRDAEAAIEKSVAAGRIPLLVGGTMMYFRALLEGLAPMPASTPEVRVQIAAEAEFKGWPALHEQLMEIDPDYAKTLHPNHSQRISRALEVYRLSGKTMSEYRQLQSHLPDANAFQNRYQVVQLGLVFGDRSLLHRRIKLRFEKMLASGFVEEVCDLYNRGTLNCDLPSMRSVGYRQVWHYLDGTDSYAEMTSKGIAATRQLAKRQLTWLRGWDNINTIVVDKTSQTGVKEMRSLREIVQEALKFFPIKAA